MAKFDNTQLSKLNRQELLELLVEQGEQLERTQEELAITKARATYQERIARLAEDAAARLSGILEAAQLAQQQYSQNLKDLKSAMGVTAESVSTDDGSDQTYDASSNSSTYSTQANYGYNYSTGYNQGTSSSSYTYPSTSTAATTSTASTANSSYYQNTYPISGYTYSNGYYYPTYDTTAYDTTGGGGAQ